ncbi:MAG: hypothetical protein GY718_09430, partial [Lentisphaerae bacterium]|nr:hypothetical protein [Lentisphaerota bacterium]
MKVTFIQPYYHNVWEALGVGYIIGSLKDNYQGELEVDFYQGYFDKNFDIMNGAKDSDIIFFSCTSPAYKHGIKLAQWFKGHNKDIHIVFGGWHPTALPVDVLTESCVDQVVIGEGEAAVLRIVGGERQPIIRGSAVHLNHLRWPDRKAIKNERTIDLC